jgi:hypothetical protein
VLLFAIMCGGLGEAFELLRIHVGGRAAGWPIRGALWLAYGLLAGALLVARASCSGAARSRWPRRSRRLC